MVKVESYLNEKLKLHAAAVWMEVYTVYNITYADIAGWSSRCRIELALNYIATCSCGTNSIFNRKWS